MKYSRQDTSWLNPSDYQTLYEYALKDPDAFWAEQAEKYLTWFHPWQEVKQGDFATGSVSWYTGGQLNASYNCLDRHLSKDNLAIIWEGDKPEETRQITYKELHQLVCQFANVLNNQGIKKGDRVCIYLPMIPEAVIAMLACARIGAIHTVVFAGFSAQALVTRLLDTRATLLITADAGIRGGKIIPLKDNADAALESCPDVSTVLVIQRTPSDITWNPKRDIWYHEAMQLADTVFEPVKMESNDPLFILYTSGSTGNPKGIQHATGGYLVYAALTFHYIFDYHPGDIYWCTADVGWITGHTYGVYGPLLQGATLVLYEGTLNYPDYSRYWQIIDKYQVNIFYTAPTAIRALRREGDQWLEKSSRKSLTLLGTVGEPLNPDVWEWYYQVVGKQSCPIVDTWWQTETGAALISPIPGITPLKPGSATLPLFGICPAIVDENGQEILDDTKGHLVIKQPWPGMMQTIYGDHTRFLDTYFHKIPGVYFTGDEARKDADGYFWITGRNDDVIKVSGHRIGSAELESAFLQHPAVSEAAVVAIPHPIKGQAIYAFVTLKKGQHTSEQLRKELIEHIRKEIGALAAPETIQWAADLPKTRSGKIMRRILRAIACGEDLGDISTLSNADVVTSLRHPERN